MADDRQRMTLMWSSRSPFVRKVMIAAHEANLADRIDTRAEVVTPTSKSETLRAANPLGMLPTLVLADGTAVYDSHVICEHLNHVSGGRLIPATWPDRLAVLRTAALADGLLDKALKWLDERFRPEPLRQTEKIAGFRRDIVSALDALEKEALSSVLADLGAITAAAALTYLDFRFAAELPWRDGRPRLKAWLATVEKRSSMAVTRYQG